MKKLFLLAGLCFFLFACNNSVKKVKNNGADTILTEVPDRHYAEISLDYEGIYKGVLPAADCPGIETTLTLNPDKSFTLHSVYMEKNTSFVATGTYTVEKDLLTLKETSKEWSYYKVEENRLRKLDKDKKEITGELANHYVLKKSVRDIKQNNTEI